MHGYGAWRIEMSGTRLCLKIRYQHSSDVILLGVIVFLFSLLILYLAYSSIRPASASELQTVQFVPGRRHFYLTKIAYNGAHADDSSVCAIGYHFASLWELLDPSELVYNSTLGWNWDDVSLIGDMGMGPPGSSSGWIRTGSYSQPFTDPGIGNCYAWSSDLGTDSGTVVYLESNWNIASNTFGWHTGYGYCNTSYLVWCVEDYTKEIYLPLVKK